MFFCNIKISFLAFLSVLKTICVHFLLLLLDIKPDGEFQIYSCSDEALPTETDISESDGRKKRYNAGPKNGTKDTGRSQEPLSYLQRDEVLGVLYST